MKEIRRYYSLHKFLAFSWPRLYGVVFRYKKIFKYIVSGGLAATVSVTTIFVLTDFLGMWYLFSAVVAFVLSVFVSFLLQKFWTFKNQSTHNIGKQFILYSIVMFLALLLNTILVYVFVEYAKLWYVLAQVWAGVLVAISNFIFYQRLIFGA